MIMKKVGFLVITMLACYAAICQTPRITFKAPMKYPEGVAFNEKNNTFYVSSVKDATIGTVDASGNYKMFYQDKELKSSYGMKINAAKNQLWVCAGDANYSDYSDSATHKKMIRLIGIDLSTGKKVQDINLSKLYNGKHFANDLAFDDKGNAYITDSYSPVIYKIDAQGKASVFAENEMFKGEDVGLNGIVYSPQGFLLTVNNATGAILKVDINNPANVTKVKINELFPGADGLLWDAQGNLVLIQNEGNDKANQIASTDGWATAKLKAATSILDRFQYPTTGVMQGGKIYLLNAKLNDLNDPTRKPSEEFSLQQVVFKPI
jgi:DNA-binding beta-propeller fold protein YncE